MLLFLRERRPHCAEVCRHSSAVDIFVFRLEHLEHTAVDVISFALAVVRVIGAVVYHLFLFYLFIIFFFCSDCELNPSSSTLERGNFPGTVANNANHKVCCGR